MTRQSTSLRTFLAMVLLASSAAAAQKGPDPVESKLVARKVVAVEGTEKLVDATSAKPGDVIEYTATYRNAGREAVRGLEATLPIPHETQFIPGTTRPATAKASVDGRDFGDIPLRRQSARDGKAAGELVPYGEYRFLRWSTQELGGGKTVAFSARVMVVDDLSRGGAAAGGNAR